MDWFLDLKPKQNFCRAAQLFLYLKLYSACVACDKVCYTHTHTHSLTQEPSITPDDSLGWRTMSYNKPLTKGAIQELLFVPWLKIHSPSIFHFLPYSYCVDFMRSFLCLFTRWHISVKTGLTEGDRMHKIHRHLGIVIYYDIRHIYHIYNFLKG